MSTKEKNSVVPWIKILLMVQPSESPRRGTAWRLRPRALMFPIRLIVHGARNNRRKNLRCAPRPASGYESNISWPRSANFESSYGESISFLNEKKVRSRSSFAFP